MLGYLGLLFVSLLIIAFVPTVSSFPPKIMNYRTMKILLTHTQTENGLRRCSRDEAVHTKRKVSSKGPSQQRLFLKIS
jgi:hypothetical protein